MPVRKKPKESLDDLLASSSSEGFSLKQGEGESSDDDSRDAKTTSSRTKSPVVTEPIQTVSPVNEAGEDDSFPIMLPTSWLATALPPPGDCNLLVQFDPEEATRLEYEGTSGAIGRFEAGPNGIILDLKGRQYQGSLLPGPTALLVGLSKGKQLRLEGITDEFSSLVQTSDVMAKLDAIVTGAELDEGYKYVEENVNRVEKSKGDDVPDEVNPAKRKRGTSKTPAKRRKKTSQ